METEPITEIETGTEEETTVYSGNDYTEILNIINENNVTGFTHVESELIDLHEDIQTLTETVTEIKQIAVLEHNTVDKMGAVMYFFLGVFTLFILIKLFKLFF